MKLSKAICTATVFVALVAVLWFGMTTPTPRMFCNIGWLPCGVNSPPILMWVLIVMVMPCVALLILAFVASSICDELNNRFKPRG